MNKLDYNDGDFNLTLLSHDRFSKPSRDGVTRRACFTQNFLEPLKIDDKWEVSLLQAFLPAKSNTKPEIILERSDGTKSVLDIPDDNYTQYWEIFNEIKAVKQPSVASEQYHIVCYMMDGSEYSFKHLKRHSSTSINITTPNSYGDILTELNKAYTAASLGPTQDVFTQYSHPSVYNRFFRSSILFKGYKDLLEYDSSLLNFRSATDVFFTPGNSLTIKSVLGSLGVTGNRVIIALSNNLASKLNLNNKTNLDNNWTTNSKATIVFYNSQEYVFLYSSDGFKLTRTTPFEGVLTDFVNNVNGEWLCNINSGDTLKFLDLEVLHTTDITPFLSKEIKEPIAEFVINLSLIVADDCLNNSQLIPFLELVYTDGKLNYHENSRYKFKRVQKGVYSGIDVEIRQVSRTKSLIKYPKWWRGQTILVLFFKKTYNQAIWK